MKRMTVSQQLNSSTAQWLNGSMAQWLNGSMVPCISKIHYLMYRVRFTEGRHIYRASLWGIMKTKTAEKNSQNLPGSFLIQ
jgi:hypothetical protein